MLGFLTRHWLGINMLFFVIEVTEAQAIAQKLYS